MVLPFSIRKTIWESISNKVSRGKVTQKSTSLPKFYGQIVIFHIITIKSKRDSTTTTLKEASISPTKISFTKTCLQLDARSTLSLSLFHRNMICWWLRMTVLVFFIFWELWVSRFSIFWTSRTKNIRFLKCVSTPSSSRE